LIIPRFEFVIPRNAPTCCSVNLVETISETLHAM
jgi:hypothetical protein